MCGGKEELGEGGGGGVELLYGQVKERSVAVLWGAKKYKKN